MTGPVLKVCGIRNEATAAAVAPLAVDVLGFILAPSKRRVSAAEAGRMIAACRANGGKQRFAGVFVNPSLEELEEVLSAAPLDILQLHGAESPAFAAEVREHFPNVEVWKAIGVRGEDANEAAAGLEPYAGLLDGLLLDAYDPHVGGGTGRTFRWDVIPVYEAWTKRQGIPLLIAGGLTPDNVGGLLEAYPVGGVDVSSGVETEGVKDLEKIITFVRRVKL